jgi:hypothetical protein
LNLYGFVGNDGVGRWDLLGQVAVISDPEGTLSDGVPGYSIQVWHKVGDPKGSYVQDVSITRAMRGCSSNTSTTRRARSIDLWRNKDLIKGGSIITDYTKPDAPTFIIDGWSSPNIGEQCSYREMNLAVLHESTDRFIDGLEGALNYMGYGEIEDQIIIPYPYPRDSSEIDLELHSNITEVLTSFAVVHEFEFSYYFDDDCNGDGIVKEGYEVFGDVRISNAK